MTRRRAFLAGVACGALLYRFLRILKGTFAEEAARMPPWY